MSLAPSARLRFSASSTTWTFCASAIDVQPAISARVRPQPTHTPSDRVRRSLRTDCRPSAPLSTALRRDCGGGVPPRYRTAAPRGSKRPKVLRDNPFSPSPNRLDAGHDDENEDLHRRRRRHHRARNPRTARRSARTFRSSRSRPRRARTPPPSATFSLPSTSRFCVCRTTRPEKPSRSATRSARRARALLDASTAHRVAEGWVYGFRGALQGTGGGDRPRRAASPTSAATPPARSRSFVRSSTPGLSGRASR